MRMGFWSTDRSARATLLAGFAPRPPAPCTRILLRSSEESGVSAGAQVRAECVGVRRIGSARSSDEARNMIGTRERAIQIGSLHTERPDKSGSSEAGENADLADFTDLIRSIREIRVSSCLTAYF